MNLLGRTLIAGAAALMAAGGLMAGPDFSHPHYHLGNTDKDGNFCLWTEVTSLICKDGTEIPLRLRFDAGPDTGVPLFGKFWWCPLLEATCVPRSEYSSLMTTLGGHVMVLRNKKDGTFATDDGTYVGRNASPSEVVVTGEGWEYRYVAGKLREARKTNGAVDLEWVYRGSQLLSINQKGAGPLLVLEYGAPTGIPSALLVDKMKFALKAQQVPLVSAVTGVPLVVGYASSLADFNDGRTPASFPIHLERDGSYVMEYRAMDPDLSTNTFAWDAVTGLARSDSYWAYTVKKSETGTLVSRKNPRGEVESYVFDKQSGDAVYQTADGRVTTRTYFTAAGPTFNLIRKLVATKDGKEVENTRWSYDETGRMVREAGLHHEKEWTWQPNGKLASYSWVREGRLMAKETYDATGQMMERQIEGGVDFKYSYEAGKTIVQRWSNGQLQLTEVQDPAQRQKVVFRADPANGSLTPVAAPLNFPSVPPSAKELDSARASAQRAIQNVTYGKAN